MTKNEIIDKISSEKRVENLINDIVKDRDVDFIDDLSQDIYINLLLKEDEKIIYMYQNDSIDFFIKKMIRNNLYSKYSPYYYKYIRFKTKTINIDEIQDI